MNQYSLGTDVFCSVTFKNRSRVEADPTAVFFEVTDSEGEVTQFTYPNAAIVRTAAGKYESTIDASKPGTWHYRFYSTGTGKAAAEGSFSVDRSNFG